ncbi:MAG TPA: hypothetical protein VFJ43_11715, partial [Bacteroidia bacterium]|nr:hypothetical protein [Bacteroidia bacterium]
MKNFLKRTVFFLLVITILSSGLIYIFYSKLVERYMPTVEQIGEIHIVIKNDTSYISSRLLVKNNSFLKIDIDTLKYKIFLFDKIYLESARALDCKLRGEGTDTIDFSMQIPYVTILSDLKTQRKIGDSASYTINVSLQYSTFLGIREIPITKSAKIKIPQPPDLEIAGIKYKKIRRKKILANAEIRIINHSPVTVSITELNYSMKILKQGHLKGKFKVPLAIKPNETTLINLPIEISVDNLGKTVFQVFMNKDNYDYTISMNALLTSTDPLKKSFQIDLTKSGRMELI